ncbi:class I SAM-dependent methyltransferase [Streptomyces sp. NPDC048196]|uniref:class I SAM-dependent methyltransferase n=1 Tax=Streptomyces sp. NPDC048196 TaxID=3154712 RepID=UPI0033F68FCB
MATVREQEAFLRAFHAAHPAVTVRAMAHGRAEDGRSSYEILRDRVAACDRVLDLGCGDGLLLELLAERGRRTDRALADRELADRALTDRERTDRALTDGELADRALTDRERTDRALTDGELADRAPADRELAGLDLAAEELALARRRPGLARADLRAGRAQQLPFEDGRFDGCVSHMALMLMGDIEQVAAEVARVLAPGGTLAVALGGGAAGGEAYTAFLRVARPLFAAAPADQRIPSLGDRRLRNREGFDAVFGPAGFGPVRWETVRIDLTGPPERVWATMGGFYDLGPLDPAVTADLRTRFEREAASLALPDGRIPCAMRVHIATAMRVHIATAVRGA